MIVEGKTGCFVELEQQSESPFEAIDPETFARDLAGAINELMGDSNQCEKMGKAGRQRVIEEFSWSAIAKQTLDLYENVCAE